jgi:outer membrane protein assembly factor BamB
MAERIPEYDALKLEFERGVGGSYMVIAESADGRRVRGSFTPPLTDEELDDFVRDVGLVRRSRRSQQGRLKEIERFGSELFAALIREQVAGVYHDARTAAQHRKRGLRITLNLSGAPELMRLPWEFLYRRPRFFSQSMSTPVVRSLDLESARRPQEVRLPLRILGMVSSPSGYTELDADEERRKLEGALSRLRDGGLVELEWLERATLAEFGRRVAEPDEIHVLHYIGHGAYNETTESGILVLETPRGRAQDVSGRTLGSMLQDEESLRLVVLNSCEGARTSRIDPFSGVAASLLEFDIPAVVGMQFEITDEAAIAFGEEFYRQLAHGLPIDAALGPARRAIVAADKGAEFGTPVLFLRAADARLFEPTLVEPSSLTTRPAGSRPTGPVAPSRSDVASASGASLDVLGPEQWAARVTGAIRSAPALGPGGDVYVVTEAGALHAVGADGRMRWTAVVGGARHFAAPSVTVAPGGRVYVVFDGYLFAFDPGGALAWKWTAPLGVTAPPAFDGSGCVFAMTNKSQLCAVSEAGSELWRRTLCGVSGGGTWPGPAWNGRGSVYAVCKGDGVHAVDGARGELAWSVPTNDKMESTPVVGADGTGYFASTGGWVFAINPDGSQRWLASVAPPPGKIAMVDAPLALAVDGSIVVAPRHGSLYSVSADGQVRWEFPIGGQGTGGRPVAVSPFGAVYAATTKGELVVVGPDGTHRASVRPGEAPSAPAVGSNGVLYVGVGASLHAIAVDT